MSKGYTIAFAMTAPVAPATARPQGGSGASLDCPAIVKGLRTVVDECQDRVNVNLKKS
jgi:hypothetical protein